MLIYSDLWRPRTSCPFLVKIVYFLFEDSGVNFLALLASYKYCEKMPTALTHIQEEN